ncbi:MAG: FtsX-like permease family protein, partial [Chloroflexota bacterium]
WVTVDLISMEEFENNSIYKRVNIEGANTPGTRDILIEKLVLEELEVNVGDQIQVQLANGTITTMTAVGITQDQEALPIDFSSPPQAYVSMNALTWLGESKDLNRLYITLSRNQGDELFINDLAEDIEEKLEDSGYAVYRSRKSPTLEHPMASIIQAFLGVMGALGLLVTILSSSLITNTLTSLLNQHLRQIGIMKLIGGRSKQIRDMYIVMILSFSLIALAIAIPAASIAGFRVASFIAGQLGIPLQGYHIVPVAVLLQVVLGISVPLAAGFFPVNSGAKTKVRRAISNQRPEDEITSIGWLEKLGEWFKWLTRPLLLSIRNTFRRKGRLALTLFTLSMSGAIFIAVFNVRDSMQFHMDKLGKNFIADVTLNFEQPHQIARIQHLLSKDLNIVKVEGWAAASAEILFSDDSLADELQILAPPADSKLVEVEMISGRWLLPGDKKKLLVSDAIWAVMPEAKPGDKIRVQLVGDDLIQEWEIIGIFNFTNQLGDVFGYAPYEFIAQEIGMSNFSFSYRVETAEHTRESQAATVLALDKLFQDRDLELVSAEGGLSIMDQANDSISILVTFFLSMAMLTALVGSIGLMGTMSMNVFERTREIGIMRAIGAVDREIMKTVILEGTVIGVLSWFIGAILSLPISSLLLYIVSVAMFNSPMTLIITVDGFLIWIIAILVLAVLASAMPARNASKLTIREVLAYE